MDYVKDNDIPYMEDDSNCDLSLRRNALRHALNAFAPGATAALAMAATLAADEDAALKQLAREWLDANSAQDQERLTLPRPALRKLPEGLIRRVARECWQKMGLCAPTVDITQIVVKYTFGAAGRHFECRNDAGQWCRLASTRESLVFSKEYLNTRQL